MIRDSNPHSANFMGSKYLFPPIVFFFKGFSDNLLAEGVYDPDEKIQVKNSIQYFLFFKQPPHILLKITPTKDKIKILSHTVQCTCTEHAG